MFPYAVPRLKSAPSWQSERLCHQRKQQLGPFGVSLVVGVEVERPAWGARGLLAVLELVAPEPVGLVLLEVG